MRFVQILLLSMIFTIALASSADFAPAQLDLEDYPSFFIQNERLDVEFIVGEFADPEDVIGLAEIASSLRTNLEKEIKKEDDNLFEVDIKGNPQDELAELYLDVLNKKKSEAAQMILDTTLDREELMDKNIILVGGPCVNWVSAHFMGNPENCVDGFLPGRAYLQLFPNGKGTVLMVAGYSKEDTRRAAGVLANYQDYSANMVGERLRISSAWIDEITIK